MRKLRLITKRYEIDDQPNEFLIPWSVAVLMFRTHLCNMFLRRGHGLQDCLKLLSDPTGDNVPLIDEAFKELWDDQGSKPMNLHYGIASRPGVPMQMVECPVHDTPIRVQPVPQEPKPNEV